MLTQPEKSLANCPEKSALKNYLLGKLPEEILDQFESHFSDCANCEETLRGLDANDTFSQLVNSAADSSAELAEQDKQFVGNLITQMKSENRFHRLDAELAEKAAEVTRLLTPPEDESDAIGAFGDYQIESLIGVGSTGVVFRAIDRNLDRLVALKILRPSLGRAARERFMAEARLAAAIEHQNVVTIYHVGEEEVGGLHPIAFIAMQWIAGETLEDRFKKVAFLPEDEVKAIATQIALGLSAAHQKNLIHRDIKPANIWLCEESDRVIILDFGLARIADDDPHMTNTGMLAGTPNFMSPEQTRGQELDGRSDLFSLGCLMYRTATGKLPFGSSGVLATLQSIQAHSPNPPATLNPHISEDFSDLVMCLLEKQAANRPGNAAELIDAIRLPRMKWSFVAANHQKVEAKSKTLPQRSSGFTAWISLAILFGLIASFGYMFAPDIIRIATNQGELVIDSKDKDIKIEVLSGGEVIKVIDLKTSQTIDIKAGEYSFQVQDARNGFSVSPSKLTMKRGGKEVVTISSSDKGEPQTLSPATSKETTDAITYKGKTLAEWEKVILFEKDPEIVTAAIKATESFLNGDKGTRAYAIKIVSDLARKTCSKNLTRYSFYYSAFSSFFSKLPPNEIWQFYQSTYTLDEPGNKAARWILEPTMIFRGDEKLEQQRIYRDLIIENEETVVAHVIALLNSEREDEVSLGKNLLYRLAEDVFGQSPEFGRSTNPYLQDLVHRPFSQKSKQMFREFAYSCNDSLRQLSVIVQLIRNGDFSDRNLSIVCDAFSNDAVHALNAWDLFESNQLPLSLRKKGVLPVMAFIMDSPKCLAVYKLRYASNQRRPAFETARMRWIRALSKFEADGGPALDALKDLLFETTDQIFAEAIYSAIVSIEEAIAVKNGSPRIHISMPINGRFIGTGKAKVTVVNRGTRPLENTSIQVNLDNVTSATTATNGFKLSQAGKTLTWKIEKLLPDKNAEIEIMLKVEKPGSDIQLKASVFSNGVLLTTNSRRAKTVFWEKKLSLQTVEQQTTQNSRAEAHSPSGPTYDGKNFNEWISILSTERNHKTVNSAIKALGELSRDDPEMQTTAIDEIRPLVRRYGSILVDDQNRVESINRFFSLVNPNVIIDFAIEEIKSGTPQSQEHLFWLLSPEIMIGYAQVNDLAMIETRKATFRKNLNSRLLEFSNACVNAMESADSENKIHVANVLQRAIECATEPPKQRSGMGGGLFNQVKPLRQEPKLDPAIIKYLSEKMQSTKDAELATYIAIELVRNGVTDKVAIERIKQSFFDENMPEWIPVIIYHKVLLHESNRHFIQTILKLFHQDSLVDQLVKGAGDPRLRSALILSGEWSSQPTPDSIRIRLIQKLGNLGSQASEAKEWLTEQSTLQVPWANEAKKAISLIEADEKTEKNVSPIQDPSIEKAKTPTLPKISSLNKPTAEGANTATVSTYEGKTYEQWLTILNSEKSPVIIRTGILAIGELTVENPELIETSLTVIAELMKQYGEFWRNSSPSNFSKEFAMFFRAVPPERAIRFFLDQFQKGNTKIQKQLYWLLIPSMVYPEGSFKTREICDAKRKEYRDQIKSQMVGIVKTVLADLNCEKADHRYALLAMLNSAINGPSFQTTENDRYVTKYLDIAPVNKSLVALLSSEIKLTKFADVKLAIALTMTLWGASNDLTVQVIVDELNSPSLTVNDYLSILQACSKVDEENQSRLVDSLFHIRAGAKIRTELYYRYQRDPSKFTKRNGIRFGGTRTDLLQLVGSFGSRATSSLGHLDQIAKHDSPEGKVAKQIATEIRQQVVLDRAKEKLTYVEFPVEIVAKLNSEKNARFVKLKISFSIQQSQRGFLTLRLDAKKRALLNELTSLLEKETVESLRGPSGQNQLREKLLKTCNEVLFKDEVVEIDNVHFSSFNLQ